MLSLRCALGTSNGRGEMSASGVVSSARAELGQPSRANLGVRSTRRRTKSLWLRHPYTGLKQARSGCCCCNFSRPAIFAPTFCASFVVDLLRCARLALGLLATASARVEAGGQVHARARERREKSSPGAGRVSRDQDGIPLRKQYEAVAMLRVVPRQAGSKQRK